MTAAGDITVVAGGWSVRNVALDRLVGRVIAVNDAALHLETWDHAVSMDRLWFESRAQKVWLRSMEDSPFGEIWIRENAAQNFTREQIERQPNITLFRCDHESDEFTPTLRDQYDRTQLNGRNSGACALNLAWHLKPARLFLLGFDMNRAPDGQAYWYPPYPWSKSEKGGSSAANYKTWAAGIAHARARFDEIGTLVFNVSPSSAVDAFPKMTPREYLKVAR